MCGCARSSAQQSRHAFCALLTYTLIMTITRLHAALRPSTESGSKLIGLVFRLARFGFVGGLATATHASVAVASLKFFLFHPVVANLTGFIAAFSVSMMGHSMFTFRTPITANRALKFSLVAVSGVCMSSAFVLLADTYSGLSRTVILALAALATPLFTFIAHSLWTFRYVAEPEVR